MIRLPVLTVAAGLTLSFVPTAQATFMIDWVNRSTSGFDAAELAVVDTAISRWESVILDTDGNAATADTFSITIVEEGFTPLGAIDPTSITEINMLPASAKMTIDNGTRSALGFYVDLTPETDEEYNVHSTVDTYGNVPRSFLPGPSRRIDLLTLVTHELGHALGFAEGYTKWNAATDDATSTLNYAPSASAALLGNANGDLLSHLSCATPSTLFDLMCSAGSFENPATTSVSDGGKSDRRHITELDLDILAGVYGYTVNKAALLTIADTRAATELAEPSTAVLLGLGMLLVPLAARRRRAKAPVAG